MSFHHPDHPFSKLREITIHPLLACNLACGYCYQDAERTSRPVTPRLSGREWAARVDKLYSLSDVAELDIVITGGEPLLMGTAWYREFLETAAATLRPKGKRLLYHIQTNASLPVPDDLRELFREHEVRFSIHYDGLIEGDDLKSHDRHAVIRELAAASFPLTAIVVGTTPALQCLPETLDFFQAVGVSHYRLNPVGGEGRGRIDHNPGPRQRAVAEFLTGFHAWRNGFKPYESGIIWKFVAFCRTEIDHRPRPTSVTPQSCGGGETSLTIYPDGSIYPCGFFCDLSGPCFNIRDVDRLDAAMAGRQHNACKQRSEVFEKRCPPCEALIFCEAYCAMAAQRDNHEVLCEAQRELLTLMRENPAVTTTIANAFLDFREAADAVELTKKAAAG